jgi:hypothetical protein
MSTVSYKLYTTYLNNCLISIICLYYTQKVNDLLSCFLLNNLRGIYMNMRKTIFVLAFSSLVAVATGAFAEGTPSPSQVSKPSSAPVSKLGSAPVSKTGSGPVSKLGSAPVSKTGSGPVSNVGSQRYGAKTQARTSSSVAVDDTRSRKRMSTSSPLPGPEVD